MLILAADNEATSLLNKTCGALLISPCLAKAFPLSGALSCGVRVELVGPTMLVVPGQGQLSLDSAAA